MLGSIDDNQSRVEVKLRSENDSHLTIDLVLFVVSGLLMSRSSSCWMAVSRKPIVRALARDADVS